MKKADAITGRMIVGNVKEMTLDELSTLSLTLTGIITPLAKLPWRNDVQRETLKLARDRRLKVRKELRERAKAAQMRLPWDDENKA